MEAGLIPTRYVNVAASVAYGDLPDPLFRTYTRLVGLAWRDREYDQTQLPVLTLAEAALLCRLKPRAMRLHLLALARVGLVECQGTPQALQIHILTGKVQTFAHVQNFALPDDDVVDDDPLSLEKGQQQHAGVQNFAHEQANLAALAECGVDPKIGEAQAVAVLAHVTPELIAAWHAELQARAGVRNPPGYLLHVLRTTAQAPRAETRGGARMTTPATPVPVQPPLPEMPEALHAQLDDLGFTGPRDSVAALYADDPEFVNAWATYCVQHRTELRNPAGFLRNALRGEAYPPEAITLPMPEPALPAAVPPPSDPVQDLWEQALAELELQLVRGVFDTHLRGSRALEVVDGQWIIGVRTGKSVAWCDAQLRTPIERTLRDLTGAEPKCEFVTLEVGHGVA